MPASFLEDNNLEGLAQETLDNVRKKLLDLTMRNRLLNFKETVKTIRIVDELPDQVFDMLVSEGQSMELLPYEPPKEEKSVDEAETPVEEPEELQQDKREICPLATSDIDSFSKKYGLEASQVSFIVSKVQELGGVEAVRMQYAKTSPVCKFARDYAAMIYDEETSREILETEAQRVDDGEKDGVMLPEIDLGNELPREMAKDCEKHNDRFLQTPLIKKQLEKRCTLVTRDFKAAINETGANLLYLAIGFLEWTQSGESERKAQAPLVLIPLEIERERVNREDELYAFEVSFSTEYIESNLSLVELLDNNFGLKLPEFTIEKRPEEYFEEVARVVAGQEGWSIHREMVIGFFSFSKLRIYKDLDSAAWPEGAGPLDNQAVAELLVGRDKESQTGLGVGQAADLEPSEAIDNVPLVLDADGSQLAAIRDILFGSDNMVVHGPPGTGKSQTITNLIAAALSQSKTILFVSEKKAALDVVRKRLNSVNLGDFCLELHSHRTGKGSLHADLERRLKQKYGNVSDFDAKIEYRKRQRERLVEYYDALTMARGNIGKSAYEILGEAEKWRLEVATPDIDLAYENALSLDQTTIDVIAGQVEELARLLEDLSQEAIEAWSGYSPKGVLPDDERKVHKALVDAEEETQRLIASFSSAGLGSNMSFGALRRLAYVNVETLQSVPCSWRQDAAHVFGEIDGRNAVQTLAVELESYRKLCDEVSNVFGNVVNVSLREVSGAKTAAENLRDYGFESWTIAELENIQNVGMQFVEFRDKVAKATDSISHLFPEFVLNVKCCDVICELSDLLESLPPSFALHIYPRHMSRLGLLYLPEAKKSALELSEKLHELSERFVISKLPAMSRLKELVDIFANRPGFVGRLFASEYKDAKKEFLGFRSKTNRVSPEEGLEGLKQLVGVLELIDCFESDENYTILFGPMFVGLDTEWDKLEAQITATRELFRLLESEISTKAVLNDFEHHQEAIRSVAEVVRLSKSEMDSLLDTFKVHGLTKEASFNDFAQKLERTVEEVEASLPAILDLHIAGNQTVAELIDATEKFTNCISLKEDIGKDQQYKTILAEFFNGIDTDIRPLVEMNEWVISVAEAQACGDDILKWLLAEQTSARGKRLVSLVETSSDYLEAINNDVHCLEVLGPLDCDEWLACCMDSCPIQRAGEKFQFALEHISFLQRWSAYQGLKQKLVESGLGAVVAEIERGKVAASKAGSLYRFVMFNSMARQLVRENEVLRDFQGAVYEQVRLCLKELEVELEGLSQRKIAWAASRKTPPSGVSYGRVRDYTELSLINHEIGKKKSHIPVRQLVRRSVKALQALKPCFMMSPMSVAQYLAPGSVYFDLVIMDEASQLRLEDALGVVMRGKQVVVVGDPKQLPPTSFFDKNIEIDSDDETIADNAESILDVAQNCFPNSWLRWHYRSENERLIAFSNAQFYGGDLVVFPTPQKTGGDTGVFHHYIENSYSQKSKGGVVNRLEAESVAKAIRTHFHKYEDLSLGVATFNVKQCELIQDELDRLCREDKWLEDKIKKWEDTPDSFFIKNLENVQGDERDVIFISTTYGPDKESGLVTQRFGPINSASGWRRLNVIVTRAKKQVHVFTSLRSTDVKLTPGSLQGVVALRNYLEFLETGRIPDWGEVNPDRGPDSSFEVAVAHALNQRGYKTAYQVGVAGFFIDIGVYHPQREGEFILGVECDGATYHSAKSVRDRDILRQSILESKGWDIHRIWSTDWFKNRDNEVEKLLAVLDGLVAKTTAVQMPSSKKDVPSELYKPQKDVVSTSGASEDEELRNALIEFREEKIQPEYEDVSMTILSNPWIERFVERKPITQEDFCDFPLNEREAINGGTEYLKDILSLIEDFV